tara:strand:+ start:40805 stop:42730 length:1926 start_codon:yes stop_codon:yes gene_type:complete
LFLILFCEFLILGHLKNNYSLFLFSFLISFISFSQQHFSETITHPDLWLKSDIINYSDSLNISTFNFNPILNSEKLGKKKDLELGLDRFSSIFLVFESDKKDEITIADISIDGEKRRITTSGILKNNKKFVEINPKNGVILNYNLFSSLTQKENYVKILGDKIIKEKDSIKFLEILYYPKKLSDLDKSKVETYLSLKHGISLSSDKIYVNSENDTIWNPKKNVGFNQNVTGIGFDINLLNFKQLQSFNSKGDLEAGFNEIKPFNKLNNSNVTNKTYLIWGENNRETIFSKLEKDKNFQTLSKIWKFKSINNSQDSLKIQLKFLKEKMKFLKDSIKTDEGLYLAVSPLYDIKNNLKEENLIPLSKEDSSYYYYDNIDITAFNESFYITLIKAPKLLVEYHHEHKCFTETITESPLEIEVIQGVSPYSINLSQKDYEKNFSFDDKLFRITDLPKGKIHIKLHDSNGNSQLDTIYIKESKIEVAMEEAYYLENSDILVEPKIFGISKNELKFEWINIEENKVIGTDSRITLLKKGDYQLKINTKEGCKKIIPFSVKRKKLNENGDISIYPNPVKNNSTFNISLNFLKETSVQIEIRDPIGRLILQKNFEGSNGYKYSNSLNTSGTYLIFITSRNETTVKKLIIQ